MIRCGATHAAINPRYTNRDPRLALIYIISFYVPTRCTPFPSKCPSYPFFFFFTQHLSLALLYARLGAVWSEALVFMSVTLAPGLAGSIWLMLTSTYSNNLQGNKYFISLRALKHYTFNYELLSASTVSSRVRLKGSRGVVTTHTVNEQKK